MTESTGARASRDDLALAEVVTIVATRWEELPAFNGAQWPDVASGIARLLPSLVDASPEVRAVAVMRLWSLVRAHPAISDSLGSATSETRGDRPPLAGVPEEDAERVWSMAVSSLTARVRSIAGERQVRVAAPTVVGVGADRVLTVELPRSPAAEHVDTALGDGPGATYTVVLHAPSDLLDIDGSREERITVHGGDNGRPVAFRVIGRSAGHATIDLDVVHDGVVVLSIPVPVDVVDGPAEVDRPTLATAHPAARVAPPRMSAAGVELRIRLDDHTAHPKLLFELHCPGHDGVHTLGAGTTQLRDSPEEYRRWVIRELERSRSRRQQWQLGEKLWRDLVPGKLRQLYTGFRSAGSMQITSDEPWIPWEIVRPFEHNRGHVDVDDEPWCLRFQLTRWLSGYLPVPDEVTLASFAFIDGSSESEGIDRFGWPDWTKARTAASGTEKLTTEGPPPIARERREITELLRCAGLSDHSPACADSASVARLVDDVAGHLGLWHVIGHGDTRGIELADGSRWTPLEIAGATEAALTRRRPLVVLNVCRSVQQGWGPAGLVGWVEALVRRCGVPLIGTQWSVTDDAAADLLVAFYRNLARGGTMGSAMTRARLEASKSRPDDPSCLAYSVYAHPNTRVVIA